MEFRRDDRAVSSVVAAVLLFGFLVLALSLYQGFVVPDHNEEVEFRHSQRVATDMMAVRNAILGTAATGDEGYATVRLGTRYPARVFAVNPPPASGSIATTERRQVAVFEDGSNVTSTVCPGSATTRFVEYVPSYNVYRGAPTLAYEQSVLYKRLPAGNVSMTGQSLVEADAIDLVLVTGRFSKSGPGAVAVETKPGVVNTTTVTDPRLVLPTRLTDSTWEDLVPTHVAVSPEPGNAVELRMTGNYTLRCTQVGIDEVPPSGVRRVGGGSG